MKRVRMLLRVSSDQQLEADGDLSVQRAILTEYITGHRDWQLDSVEYFEGSKSAYKNTAEERGLLQEILKDAANNAFDILVCYKDDRIGRLMWNTARYVLELKKYGVDIYTVKDGCISPEMDDTIGQLMLAFRYANAQKSSADTGMRVKDTAQKLVQKGKFMGGTAPYGYRLEYSGEVSKHGRALKRLVLVPEKAKVVKYIYQLSLYREFGSAKIAATLNSDERYRRLAPHDVWKSGTITSILTNPIYAGYVAYKRRERAGGRYHRLDQQDWIFSLEPDPNIAILDADTWNKVQDARHRRSAAYSGKAESADTRIRRNDGQLAFVDVMHCGCCGRKLVNGSRYNYWTIKATGERKSRQIPVYKCPAACQGAPHAPVRQYPAHQIEPFLFEVIAPLLDRLMEGEDVSALIRREREQERKTAEQDLQKELRNMTLLQQKIDVMEIHIPDAMLGESPLSLQELTAVIDRHRAQLEAQRQRVQAKEYALRSLSGESDARHILCDTPLPSWKDIFLNADTAAQRVVIDKLVARIDITKDTATIRFRITEPPLRPRISDDSGVPGQGL